MVLRRRIGFQEVILKDVSSYSLEVLGVPLRVLFLFKQDRSLLLLLAYVVTEVIS